MIGYISQDALFLAYIYIPFSESLTPVAQVSWNVPIIWQGALTGTLGKRVK